MWTQPGARFEGASLVEERTLYFEFSLPLTEAEFQDLILKYSNEETVVEPTKFVQNQNKIREILNNNLKKKFAGARR